MARTAIVTAGGTREPIDDVRVVANSSRGRFGAAIANALAERGVEVTVLGSREMLSHSDWLLPEVRAIPFGSFLDLAALLDLHLRTAPDLLFMAAAVADYSPEPAAGKIRSTGATLDLRLTKNPKLLSSLRERCGDHSFLVGFKLLSHVSATELVDVASAQCRDNRLDLTVANDLAHFTPRLHPVTLVTPDEAPVPIHATRLEVAARLVDTCLDRLDARENRTPGPLPGHPLQGAWLDQVPGIDVTLTIPDAAPWRVPPLVDDSPEAIYAAHTTRRGHRDPGAWQTPTGMIWSGSSGAARRLRRGWAAVCKTAGCRPRPAFVGPRLVGGLLDHVGTRTPVIPDAGPIPPDWILDAMDADESSRSWCLLDAWVAHASEQGAVATPDGLRPPGARTDLVPAASICLVHQDSRRVLVGRRTSGPGKGSWAFPGGHLEGDETAIEAGRRELLEEAGIDLPAITPWWVHRIHATEGSRTWRIDCAVTPVLHQPMPTRADGVEARWLDLEDALTLQPLTPGTARVLRRLRDHLLQ